MDIRHQQDEASARPLEEFITLLSNNYGALYGLGVVGMENLGVIVALDHRRGDLASGAARLQVDRGLRWFGRCGVCLERTESWEKILKH